MKPPRYRTMTMAGEPTEPRPGDIPGLIPGEAAGAIPNGVAIVKVQSEPGDANPIGTRGVVLASHRIGELVGYFVEWETMRGVPVFVSGFKIGRT